VIALIDYRAGNLTSVKKALVAVGADVFVPTVPEQLAAATGVIIPGVGHFAATRALDRTWVDAVRSFLRSGSPLLGICLGMQWLYETSDEAPDLSGLGLLPGTCIRLCGGDPLDGRAASAVKVPHVGWNTLELSARAAGTWVTAGVPDGSQVYFTHSYAAPVTRDAVATTTHGDTFAAIVECGAVAGVQFHPEKSGAVGLRVLRNFVARATAPAPQLRAAG
jgi:glutamine amidotransferase